SLLCSVIRRIRRTRSLGARVAIRGRSSSAVIGLAMCIFYQRRFRTANAQIPRLAVRAVRVADSTFGSRQRYQRAKNHSDNKEREKDAARRRGKESERE